MSWSVVFRAATSFVSVVQHGAAVADSALLRVNAESLAVLVRAPTDTSATMATFGVCALADAELPAGRVVIVVQVQLSALAAVLKLVRPGEDLELQMVAAKPDTLLVASGGGGRQMRFSLRLQTRTVLQDDLPVLRLPHKSNRLQGHVLRSLVDRTLAACPAGDAVHLALESDGRVSLCVRGAGVTALGSHRPSGAAAATSTVTVLARPLRVLCPMFAIIGHARLACGGSSLPLRVEGEMLDGGWLVAVVAPIVEEPEMS